MKIIVNEKNYTNFEYPPFVVKGKEAREPKEHEYSVGQVVVIPDETHDDPENHFVLAVVLGCIDENWDGTLRTDMHGLVSIDTIRPAVVTDFGRGNISYREVLYKECQGYNVYRNWDTYEYIIEEPNF